MLKQQKIVLLAAGLAGALVAAVLLVGTVAEVAAQGPGGRPGIGRGDHFGGRGPGRSVPAPWASKAPTSPRRSASRSGWWSISIATRSRGLLERAAEARRTLTQSVDRGQVDEAAASEVGTTAAALALAEARQRAEVLQLLTPEQRAELQKRREARAERFAERAERRKSQQ